MGDPDRRGGLSLRGNRDLAAIVRLRREAQPRADVL